jgi:DNA-binding response OmpR family regulator
MKKILVIDDDESILEALKLGIESEGFSVEATSEGEQAFQKAQEFSPNLILLDLLLSGRSGNEIARELKADISTKDIPIILLSAHPNAKNMSEDNIADFLPKPFDFDVLISTINKHIRPSS